MPKPVNDKLTRRLKERLEAGVPVWMFLDYDGTLADFAPTPDHIQPDPEVIEILVRLVEHPHIRVSVVSGRRLGHVEKLLPVEGVLLAGTYGMEIRTVEGEQVRPVPYEQVRPVLDAVKPRWQNLLKGREGFYLEDKDWALAIHAKDAEPEEAEDVISRAKAQLGEELDSREGFRVLGGHKFLEIGPELAHKGRTVSSILAQYPLPGALLLYLGDDDKDEEAFEVIQDRGGLAVAVGPRWYESRANFRLEGPEDVRAWLRELLRERSA